MMNSLSYYIFCTSLCLFFSCSDSEFAGHSLDSAKKRSSDSDSNDNDDSSSGDNNNDYQNDSIDFEEGGDQADGSDKDNIDLSEGDISQLKEKCWFAVSGTWMGHDAGNKYDDKFPGTTSGNSVQHGETFDTVGGVFLESREEPYEYGKGGKEIDKAIDFTFDSIAVAPNMHAVIKNGSGTVIFDGDGPMIGESAHYANDAKWTGDYYNALKARADIPKWMKDYLAANNALEVLPLQSARSVRILRLSATPPYKKKGQHFAGIWYFKIAKN
jgi:hypothetical protein